LFVRAVDVLRVLLSRDLELPSNYYVELVEHEVRLNWRQLHETPRQQIDAMGQSLVHSGPFAGVRVRIGELDEVLSVRFRAASDSAVSISSRIMDEAGSQIGHLGLMNLHPVGFRDPEELWRAVQQVVDYMPGYLLSSGRYFHYYGKRLLRPHEWVSFLAQFLMPCVLVSPRYVGHSLHRGFCTLRLNAVPPLKPDIPTLLSFGAER
jgi:hypothetical protein